MISVKKEGVILSTTELDFENEGVLNPAVVKDGNNVHLFYRAVKKGNLSTIGYCRLDGPLKIVERLTAPLLQPQQDYEQHGMEDPRIVKIDDIYYLTYIAFNGKDALGAVATSTDLQHFDRQGIIVPQVTYAGFDELASSNNNQVDRYRVDYGNPNSVVMDKDLMFFPRRIKGELVFLHRIKPDMQLAAVNSLDNLTPAYWQNYLQHLDEHIFLRPVYPHEIDYVGGGCPPVETEHGWLVIYHGVKNDGNGYQYSACAALFELDDPAKEITRLPYPLFSADQDYELSGDVDNVCFPTGTALFDDTLYIYYGAGDDVIACASVSLSALVQELLSVTATQTIA